MPGYITNIETKTLENDRFREVLFTAERMQLVVMALQPGEDIGAETHDDVDQFIRVEAGHRKRAPMGSRSHPTCRLGRYGYGPPPCCPASPEAPDGGAESACLRRLPPGKVR